MDEASSQPTRLEDAFDFTKLEVLAWEKEAIQQAVSSGKLRFNQKWHAGQRALQREFTIRDILNCLVHGKAKSKDLIPWDLEEKGARKPGINYDGVSLKGVGMRVKVSWTKRGYTVVTVHRRKR